MSSDEVLIVVVILTALWALSLIAVEFYQIKKGKVVITNVIIATIKKVPWVFILLALVGGFLMGHCAGT